MAAISTATYLAIASLAVGAYSTYQTAEANKDAGKAAVVAAEHQRSIADIQARAQEQEAGQSRASAQRAAVEEKRKAGIVGASARARIAASGGALDSPDLLNVVSDIDKGGEYAALTALYEGEERGRGLETAAGITRAGGQGAAYAGRAEQNLYNAAASRAYVSGAGSLLAGAAREYRDSKFGESYLEYQRRSGRAGPYSDYG